MGKIVQQWSEPRERSPGIRRWRRWMVMDCGARRIRSHRDFNDVTNAFDVSLTKKAPAC
jgi:hypothetical protein